MQKMTRKISTFGVGFVLGWFFFSSQGAFSRRWQVMDGWTLKPVEDFHTRRGAQDHSSELNEEMMLYGLKTRYSVVHKSVTKGW